MKKITKIFLTVASLIFLASFVSPAFAYTIKTIPGLEATGDFALSTGKIELALNPGESTVSNIVVTNRLGRQSKFKIDVQDFGPSDQPGELTKLYGNDSGPYSLKKYLIPEINEFTLNQGEQISIAIDVSIPSDAPAGGLYGCVLISTVPEPTQGTSNQLQGQVGLSSRLGVLFFVKVNGQVQESGSLSSFNSTHSLYTSAPVKFQYDFNNTGDIYLTPKSVITIKNIFNSTVSEINTDPFFVLPKSERTIGEDWSSKFMLGRYTATLSLDRGYGNETDTKTISFWVIPTPVIAIVIIVLLILILVVFLEKKKKNKERLQTATQKINSKKTKRNK